jgi:hypothetical protein
LIFQAARTDAVTIQHYLEAVEGLVLGAVAWLAQAVLKQVLAVFPRMPLPGAFFRES